MQIRKPTRLSTTGGSVVVPGRVLAAWEDEVTARYDVQGLKREALLEQRGVQPTQAEDLRVAAVRSGQWGNAQPWRDVPSSGVTPIDLVEVTYEPTGETVDPRVQAREAKSSPPAARVESVTLASRTPTAPSVRAPSSVAPSSAVPLYVLKGLLACYTEYMGVAARTVLKQEMIKLGVTPQDITRASLPTLVGRLAARLDTKVASDAFLRAVRLVDPALATF